MARRNGKAFVTGNSGYPKNWNLSKNLDSAAGAQRPVVGHVGNPRPQFIDRITLDTGGSAGSARSYLLDGYAVTAPATTLAAEAEGLGTALKPSGECWILAQAPLDTVSSGELREATGWDWWCSRAAKRSARQMAPYLERGFKPIIGEVPESDEGEEGAEDDAAQLGVRDRPHFIVERRRALHAGVETITLLHHADGVTELERRPYVQWSATSLMANWLKWRTGFLNIDASRIPVAGTRPALVSHAIGYEKDGSSERVGTTSQGRWPGNVWFSHAPGCVCLGVGRVKSRKADIPEADEGRSDRRNWRMGPTPATPRGYADEDGTELVEHWACAPGCPVAALDAQSGYRGPTRIDSSSECASNTWGGTFQLNRGPRGYEDAGGISRCFVVVPPEPMVYNPKVATSERWYWCASCEQAVAYTELDAHDSHDLTAHVTQKAVGLIRKLLRLICRPGGTVLDSCMGSGTTGHACIYEDMHFIGIERDPTYAAIAAARIAAAVNQRRNAADAASIEIIEEVAA